MGQENLRVVLATCNEAEANGPMVQELLGQLDQDGPLLEVIVVDTGWHDYAASSRLVWNVPY